LEYVSEKIGGLGDPRIFNSVVVLRDSEYWGEPHIRAAVASSDGPEDLLTFRYLKLRYYTGLLENDELYKIHLSL